MVNAKVYLRALVSSQSAGSGRIDRYAGAILRHFIAGDAVHQIAIGLGYGVAAIQRAFDAEGTEAERQRVRRADSISIRFLMIVDPVSAVFHQRLCHPYHARSRSSALLCKIQYNSILDSLFPA